MPQTYKKIKLLGEGSQGKVLCIFSFIYFKIKKNN